MALNARAFSRDSKQRRAAERFGRLLDQSVKSRLAVGRSQADFWRVAAVGGPQSNRTETLSSLAMRAIASPINGAIEMTRMFRATRTASVGAIVSVSTNSLSLEAAMRATAPPDRTPWVI